MATHKRDKSREKKKNLSFQSIPVTYRTIWSNKQLRHARYNRDALFMIQKA